MVYKKVDKETAFFEKVDKTDSCWLWNGRKDRCGYGVYYANKFMHKAHRYCYEITNKLKIGKQIAMHTCDTPNCLTSPVVP